MRKRSINPFLFVALLGVALLGTVAWGFVHITSDETPAFVVVYNPGNITMQLKLPAPGAALSDGNVSYNSSVQQAMQIWNAQLGVVQFNGVINGSAAYSTGNRINEIVMDTKVDGQDFPGGGTLAITQSYSDGDTTRVESDIVFNTNSPIVWDSYRGLLRRGSGAGTDLQRVALHELGHVLGLDHPDTAGQQVSAIMNSRVSDADTLLADDITGAQVLYGAPGVSQPNNNFASAAVVALSPNSTATVNGSNIAATKELLENNHAGETGGKSVWWKFTANGSGSMTVTTLGSNFDTLLAVYTGSIVSALTPVASNDDVSPPAQASNRIRTSTVTFNATNGTTYFIAVDGWDGAFGAITLNFSGSLTGGNTAPVITTQPASQTVTTGGSATFSVAATGAGTLTYQWSFAGAALSGATSDTLTLNNVQSANAGFYTVTVSNAAGSTTSNSATLTVNAPVVTPPATPPSSGGGGGGGGAPSLWFYAALALLSLGRNLRRRE